jgi:hypothetical protein
VRLAILLALAACAARPVVVDVAPTVTPWCFAGRIAVDGKEHAAKACFSSAVMCGRAQRKAQSVGGLAGLKQIGVCGRQGD